MKKISIRPEREYLREIVAKMQKGQYAIPAFQRDFVWKPEQITELFDSIIKGYPIGTIILWQPLPKECYSIKKITDDIIVEGTNVQYYILDGRQRLTAFYCCALDYENKSAKFKLYFNLEKESFEFPTKKYDDSKLVLVSDVFDTFKMLGILQKYMEITDIKKREDYITKVKTLNTILQSYEIGEVLLDNCSLDESSTVFSRINSKGTDISKVEMLQALSYKTKDCVLFAEEVKNVINKMGEYNFGDIRTDDVLNCCYKYIDKFFYEDSNLKLLLAADLNSIAKRLQNDLRTTIAFLHDECNVLSYKQLPYSRQLIALCSFFIKVQMPSDGQKKELKKWFIYTTAKQSFQNSSLGNVRPLFNRFDEFIRGEKNTAIKEYEEVELDSNLDFKYSNSSALSNLIFMSTVHRAKTIYNKDNLQYIGEYYYTEHKPADTFILLQSNDRSSIINLTKGNVDASPKGHLLINNEIVRCFLEKDDSRLMEVRRNLIIDVIREYLNSVGISCSFQMPLT